MSINEIPEQYIDNLLVVKWWPILNFYDSDVSPMRIEEMLVCAEEMEQFEQTVRDNDTNRLRTGIPLIRRRYSE